MFSEVKLISCWNSINISSANIRLHVSFCIDFSHMFELYAIITRYSFEYKNRIKIITAYKLVYVCKVTPVFLLHVKDLRRNESKLN